MNKIIKKLLLAGDKFMPELYLRQPGSTYSDSETLTKRRERFKNLDEQGI